MANRSVLIFFLVLVLPEVGGLPSVAADNAANSKAIEQAFEWFDTLRYPSLTKHDFVRVHVAAWRYPGDGPDAKHYMYGFLLTEQGKQITVLGLNLGTFTYQVTPPTASKNKRTTSSRVSLTDSATEYLKKLRTPKNDELSDFRRLGQRLTERAEVFVLARACQAAGHKQLAKELVEEAARLPDINTGRPVPIGQFQSLLAKDIAHTEMWRAVEDFGDPQVSRKELLSRFRRIGKHFPQSRHVERAKHTAEILEKMVKEDAARAVAKRKPLENMTQKERIAELIFQLRDQNGVQISQPGSCDIFFRDDFRSKREKGSPARQLVREGFAAVPQLIEAIDDERFTRSVSCHRDFYFSHYVLRVGDAAIEILSRIADREFSHEINAAVEAKVDRSTIIRQWWRGVRKRGVNNILVEGVSYGRRYAPRQARELIARDPVAALAAIITGKRNAHYREARQGLIEVAATIYRDRETAELRQAMKDAPKLSARVTAAFALLHREQSDAVPAMIAEWKQLATRNGPIGQTVPVAGEFGMLLTFLAECEHPSAIEALANDFKKRHVSERVAVVQALGSTPTFFSIRKTPQASSKSEAAILRLLMTALEDATVHTGVSGKMGIIPFQDARVCDHAGFILNKRWPQKFEFDIGDDKDELDEQRSRLLNGRRGQQ